MVQLSVFVESDKMYKMKGTVGQHEITLDSDYCHIVCFVASLIIFCNTNLWGVLLQCIEFVVLLIPGPQCVHLVTVLFC